MEVEKYIESNIPLRERVYQKMWGVVSLFFFRPFSSNVFNKWRLFVLKCFGARIGKGSIVYSDVYIPAPWKLVMGSYSCLGPSVKLHIDQVIIEDKVTVSQGSYLCTGSHDIKSLNKPFISAPIVIRKFAWIAAEAFVGPGVTINEGAVVGARAVVFKDVDAWTVVAGNPATFVKKRVVKEMITSISTSTR